MVVSTVDVFGRYTNGVPTENKEIPDEKKRRSKSVSFADWKGLALTSTFFFTRDNLSPPVRRRHKSLATHVKDDKRRQDPGEQARILNFKSYISYEKLVENVNSTNVCLEKIACYGFGMYGRIGVKNIAFEKCVAVRYTFDAWQSSEEAIARYIPGASIDNVDTFFFHIQPPKTNIDRRMEFAIRYRVCDEDYWDNNFGDNYRLVYYKTKPEMETMNLTIINDLLDRNI
jgi:hypothetical protein